MSGIFISYKRENLASVQRIVQGLRETGLLVWWDQDIAPGAPWEKTIESELEKAKVVIVAWSQAAIASENVKAEARRARNQGKLIQIFIEPCDPPLFFGEHQGVDLANWNGDTNDHRFNAIADEARAKGVGHAPIFRLGAAVCSEKEDLFLNAVSRAYARAKSEGTAAGVKLDAEAILARVLQDESVYEHWKQVILTAQANGARIINCALPSDNWACNLLLCVLESQDYARRLGIDTGRFSVRFVGGQSVSVVALRPEG